MDSLEKVTNLLGSMMDATDEQLQEILGPVPVPMARALLPVIPMMLPDTAEDLDAQLDGFHGFLEQLRSDPDSEPVALPESD